MTSRSEIVRTSFRTLIVAVFVLCCGLFWVVPQFKPLVEASSLQPSTAVVNVIRCGDWVVNYYYLLLITFLVSWLMVDRFAGKQARIHMQQQSTPRIPAPGESRLS